MSQPQRVCVLGLFLLVFYTFPAQAQQQIIITGTVLQPDKKTPVVGAGISRLGTGTVVTTTTDGRFSLIVQPHDSILIRAVGFKPALYRVKPEHGTTQQLLFVLQEAVQQLGEVEVFHTPSLVKRPPAPEPIITPPPPAPARPPTLLFNPVSYFSKEGKQRRKLRKFLTREEEKRQQQEAERLRQEQEQQRQNYNRFFKDNTGYR